MDRRIARAKRTLKKQMRSAGEREADRWLVENADYLLAALKAGLGQCKREETRLRDGAFAAAEVLFSFCKTGLPSPGVCLSALKDAFLDRPLTFSESGRLPAVLFAAVAVLAAEHAGTADFPARVRAYYALKRVEFGSVRALVCPGEKLLEADPAGIYPKMDEKTKAAYRRYFSAAAKKAGQSEQAYLEVLISRLSPEKRHVGDGLRVRTHKVCGTLLLLGQTVLARAGSLLLGFFCVRLTGVFGGWTYPAAGLLLSALLFFPLFTLLAPFVYRLGAALCPPRLLPSLDPDREDFVPEPSVIVLSSVLPPASQIGSWERRLRDLGRGAGDGDTGVVLLLDKKPAGEERLPSDETDKRTLMRLLDRLNAGGGRFAAALRSRSYLPTEKQWAGRERKRGAVSDFVRLLTAGKRDAFELLYGDESLFRDRKWMLTLDADTFVPFGSLRSLLAAAAHPMNAACGCFCPRSEATLDGGTLFSSVFTAGPLTAYSPEVSEFYTDAFGQGIFCGKGLINVRKYDETCVGAFPPGRVLSHDVLEGALLKTAFVGGVCFGERFPKSPDSFLRRASRWIRGDAQNLPFLLIKPKKGTFSPLSRWLLSDNLRRALSPAAAFAAALLSVFVPAPGGGLLLAAAVLSVSAEPLLSVLSLFGREGPALPFSTPLSPAARALLQTFLSLLLWPQSALNALDAVCRGVWRTLTKRRTLEWTTAAAAEHGGKRRGLLTLPALLGLVPGVLGGPAFKVLALLFLLGLPFSLSDGLSLPVRRKKIRLRDRDALSDWAAATWTYFEVFVGEADHDLPPDNVQFSPGKTVAHRTSPTNIGLYLVSLLAAADLGFLEKAELEKRVALTLSTVESLQTRRGLLYNWYDTKTLSPLDPAFISSVDCGNYLVCLSVLSAGLREYGLFALSARVDALVRQADLASLYDPVRRLFYVGFDAAAGTLTDAAYECFFSETLLTSFFAVAKRLVPPSHIPALKKPVRRRGGRLWALSFTGTAFEYLMPALFLPLYPGSAFAEGLSGAVRLQKRAVKNTPCPWGRTESGVYEFDAALNYGYRANGLRRLALKPDAGEERVFAPYASFLALPVDPDGAVANLRRFLSLGAYGPCGFYEALDFEDRGLHEDYMPVRSFMAHHAGMSLVAAANALLGDRFVKRCLSDPDLSAGASILRDRLPGPNVRGAFYKAPKKRRADPSAKRPAPPGTCALYRAGEAALLCLPDGTDRLLANGVSLFSDGVRAALFAGEKQIFPKQSDLRFTGRLFNGQSAPFSVSAGVGLLPDAGAFVFPVKIKNSGPDDELRLRFWGVPRLLPLFAPDVHTAFREGKSAARFVPDGAVSVFEASPGGRALAVGFFDGAPFVPAFDRETLPPPEVPLPPSAAVAAACPVIGAERRFTVRKNRTVETVLLVTSGPDAASALTALYAARRLKLPPFEKLAKNTLDAFGQALLPDLFDGSRPAAVSENFAPLSALWEQGISGDWPLLRVRADGMPDKTLGEAARLHRDLLLSGAPTDLVFVTSGETGYGQTPDRRVRRLLSPQSDRLVGASPGVRFVSPSSSSAAFLSALNAAPGTDWPPAPRKKTRPLPPVLSVQPDGPAENGFVPGGYYIGLPTPRPWGNVLANPSFGTLLTNRSLGFTWAMNARLNPLTPGSTDRTRDFGGERLLFESGGVLWDLLKGAAVYFYPDRAVYLGKAGEKRARVTVTVPRKGMEKRVSVTVSGAGTLWYRVTPTLSGEENAAMLIKGRAAGDALVFENPGNRDFPGRMTLRCPGAESSFDGLAGTLKTPVPAGQTAAFSLSYTLIRD